MNLPHKSAPSLASTTLPDRRFFESGSALNRVWEEAPYLPRCSDNKTAALVRPREYAIRYPYMQVNRNNVVSWLIFDLDHAKAMIWEDVGLPAPNLIVRNRTTGSSHLFYAITPVSTSAKARSKPIAYMKAVYAAMALRLNADLNFHSGPVAKTPGHPWWLTHELHSHTYELGFLADHVDLEPSSPWAKKPNLGAVNHSRHCILFEELRYYAYSIVAKERENGSFERFIRLLDAYAFNKNSFVAKGFEANLPLSSIKATVKSVSRWTWDRYTGSGSCRRGAMQLNKDLPLVERQRLAAAYARSARQKTNEMKVRVACRHLASLGQAITQVAVARVSGLSRQTVASYRHILAEVVNQPVSTNVVAIKKQVESNPSTVKFGVHQVTALSKFIDPNGSGLASDEVLSQKPRSNDPDPVSPSLEKTTGGILGIFPKIQVENKFVSEIRKKENPDSARMEFLRRLPALQAITATGLYFKIDRSYKPLKDKSSQRVHVNTSSGQVLEIICTMHKWFIPSQVKGADSAIDLVMLLLDVGFEKAAALLSGSAKEEYP